jgi:GST-like protein
MEELGIPYNLKLVNLDAGEQFKPDYLKICPNNKIPAIVDDEGPDGPLTLFESGLIMMYLADKTGKFIPSSANARLHVLQWVFWQVSALGPWPGLYNYFSMRAPEKIPFVIDRFGAEASRLLMLMDTQLTRHEYLAGNDYTIADIASFVAAKRAVMTFRASPGVLVETPALDRWLSALEARPAVQRGLRIPEPIDWRTGNALPKAG